MGEGVLDSFKNLKSRQSNTWCYLGCGLGSARAVPLELGPCSVPQLSLEEPIKTAILLSLAGVRSILANQWPTFLQDNALRASVLWESEWARASWARPQPCAPLRKPAGLRDVSFLDLLTVGRPIGRAVRLLQKMGAGDLRNHGNRSCPSSPPFLRLSRATCQPASQRCCQAGVPVFPGHLHGSACADGKHSPREIRQHRSSGQNTLGGRRAQAARVLEAQACSLGREHEPFKIYRTAGA